MKLKQKLIKVLRFIWNCLVFIGKRIPAWLASTLIVAVVGVTLQTQNVIARLGNLGADVGFEYLLPSLWPLLFWQAGFYTVLPNLADT